ncbi:unnamed protein product [Rotaria sordida]|uniref:Deacetylase sirtuin-type domain-containing protein n=1 Tax=Rotaria sordida TaxID=392033 RepID=A0A814NRK1_9BILA|nr:unnamed protein product [Rotaria sordida]CAF1044482.1 unnamed protein product [Rotaria sordida]CAF1094900.1 unnamed protein product [Rotaria sordida]CAF3534098.1 unnamed protein product [Rotaria sordida]CAF3615917.1 unnamed protein product [Rotaria sordida]
MTDSTELSTAANWIRQSSSILIAAGAGLSASAVNPQYGVGLDYTSVAAFRQLYPRMTQVSTMRCMYDAIGKHDWTPELMWGYLFTHVDKCRFNWGSTSVYQDLKQILSNKPIDSFVITTNADGMFEQNKFDMTRFLSTQGDYSLLQCLKPCSQQSVYEARPYIERALSHINPQTMEVPSKYIPQCPRCGGSMFYCVRGGEWFIESAFDNQRHRYRDFLHRAIDKKNDLFTIIEVGVGFNTPSVLRWPMDKLVSEFKNVRLIRINMHAPDVPVHARKEKRTIGFDGDAAQIIRQLRDMVIA